MGEPKSFDNLFDDCIAMLNKGLSTTEEEQALLNVIVSVVQKVAASLISSTQLLKDLSADDILPALHRKLENTQGILSHYDRIKTLIENSASSSGERSYILTLFFSAFLLCHNERMVKERLFSGIQPLFEVANKIYAKSSATKKAQKKARLNERAVVVRDLAQNLLTLAESYTDGEGAIESFAKSARKRIAVAEQKVLFGREEKKPLRRLQLMLKNLPGYLVRRRSFRSSTAVLSRQLDTMQNPRRRRARRYFKLFTFFRTKKSGAKQSSSGVEMSDVLKTPSLFSQA